MNSEDGDDEHELARVIRTCYVVVYWRFARDDSDFQNSEDEETKVEQYRLFFSCKCKMWLKDDQERAVLVCFQMS